MPKKLRNCKDVQRRLEYIRRLRNRVHHYESILSDQNLADIHQILSETIYWICGGIPPIVAQSQFAGTFVTGKSLIQEKFTV